MFLSEGETYGDISKQGKGEFQIETPTAVASVKGTELDVNFDFNEELTTLTVVDGLVEFGNELGTITAGALGSRFPKKSLLSLIYLGRTISAALFIMFPMTPDSVVIFSIVMGSLWLATVPLTSGLVGHIYGMKFMGTLYRIVFFSHQLGGFLGEDDIERFSEESPE